MKKKLKNKTVLCTYELPIFPIKKLVVIITNNVNSLKYKFRYENEYIDFLKVDPSLLGMTWFGYKYADDIRKCVLIVIQPENCDDDIDVDNTIAHEALHGAYHMLDYADMKLTNDTNETYAYVTGWIAGCTKEAYKKWLKKR